MFSATWLPVVIINFTEAFANIKVHNTAARDTVFVVFFQNVLNPAISGMMNKSFRDIIFCYEYLEKPSKIPNVHSSLLLQLFRIGD